MSQITDDGAGHKYWCAIPHTISRGLKSQGLSVSAKWLYVYLKSITGESGTCYRSTSTMAREAGMSRGQISAAKKELASKALITVKSGKNPRRNADRITLKDIWSLNMDEFSVHHMNTDDDDESVPSLRSETDSVHAMNTDKKECSPHEHQCSLYELGVHGAAQKKNSLRRTLEEERSHSLTSFESVSGNETTLVPDPLAAVPNTRAGRKKMPLAADDWIALWLQQQTLLPIPFDFLNDEKWWAASSILITDGFNEAWLEREFAKMVLFFQRPGQSAPRTEAGWKRFLTHWWQIADDKEQRQKRQEKLYGTTAQTRGTTGYRGEQ